MFFLELLTELTPRVKVSHIRSWTSISVEICKNHLHKYTWLNENSLLFAPT